MNSFNPENSVHHIVVDLFRDNDWRNTIINCVTKDIKAVDKILSTYHYPLFVMKPFGFYI